MSSTTAWLLNALLGVCAIDGGTLSSCKSTLLTTTAVRSNFLASSIHFEELSSTSLGGVSNFNLVSRHANRVQASTLQQ